MCSSHKLSFDSFYEWDYYNAVLKKPLYQKDCLVEVDGKICRLKIAEDLKSMELDNRYADYESEPSLVNDIFRMAMYKKDPHRSISIIIECLGRVLHADRVYIAEKNEDGIFESTYEWIKYGIDSLNKDQQHIVDQSTKLWIEKLQYGRPIIVPDVYDMKNDGMFPVDSFAQYGIHSLIINPLWNERTIHGVLAIDNPEYRDAEKYVPFLSTVGNFIDSLMISRDLMNELKRMSLVDPLTQFGNRKAMKIFEEETTRGLDLGVIFCDVCGLKYTNDYIGHDAGDALLVRAAQTIRQNFNKCDLFRMGGDEFLIVLQGIDEETLQEKTSQLRAASQAAEAPLAAGYAMRKGTNTNLDELIRIADQEMYKDKELYYRIHPDRDRRRHVIQ